MECKAPTLSPRTAYEKRGCRCRRCKDHHTARQRAYRRTPKGRETSRRASAAYYAKHGKKYESTKRANKKLARRKRFFLATMKLEGCVECGSFGNMKELHHHHFADRGNKHKLSLSSWATILEELEKCVVLCVSCHAKKHRSE